MDNSNFNASKKDLQNSLSFWLTNLNVDHKDITKIRDWMDGRLDNLRDTVIMDVKNSIR